MKERDLRNLFAATAEKYEGASQGSDQHYEIMNIYNGHKPLARGYALKITDPYCAAFVSAIAIESNMTSIIPTEVGCEPMIRLMKKKGGWVEKDNYKPERGDIAFYDWDDTGDGDCTGNSDHVGIVTKVIDGWFYVIEGNKGAAGDVGIRKMKIDGRYIRGFFVPDFSKLATDKPSSSGGSKGKIRVGSKVRIKTGARWYNGDKIPTWVLGRSWLVSEISGKRVVLDDGGLSSAIHIRYLYLDEDKPASTKPAKKPAAKFKPGDIVKFTGNKHYTNANAAASSGNPCEPGMAKVTHVSKGSKHPYHLVAVPGKGSTVYGWVSAADVESSDKKPTKKLKKGCKVKVKRGANDYYGESLAPFVFDNSYEVIELSDKRAVIGKSGAVTAAIHTDDLIVL